MDRLMPDDELSVIRTELESDFTDTNRKKEKKEERIDEILELLILSYMYGNESGNTMLESEVPIDVDRMNESVYAKVADKDWEQRVREYYDNGTVDEIMRVVITTTHWVYNDAIAEVGNKVDPVGNTVMKQWETMLDDKVRDTHEYLEGMTVPINSKFYTYDGDSARFPGDFVDASNNVNCRCRINLTYA